ncbi:MAG: hypothetical protein V1816_02255 [Pseudomonadota bacterium]
MFIAIKRGAVAALALILGLAALAFPASSPADAPFTAPELEKFLADFPGFARWIDQESQALDDLSANPRLEANLGGEAGKYLVDRGWSPPERFFIILRRVTVVIMGEEASTFQPDLIGRLEARKTAVAARSDLTSAEKEKLTAELDRALGEARRNIKPGPEKITEQEMNLIESNRGRILLTLSADASGK